MKLTPIPLPRMDSSLKKFAVMAAVIGIALTQLAGNSPIQGQLGPQDVFIPTHFIGGNTEVTLQGHPDTNYHNSMVCSSIQGTVEITQDNALENQARFWLYEYTGHEERDPQTGQMDMRTADGKFYFSAAVLRDHPGLRNKQTLSTYTEGKLYYFMGDTDVQFSCNRGIFASAVCGDGVVAASEQCDDGNTNDQDGCSNQCTTNTGFSCTGNPSVCEFLPPILPTPGPGNNDADQLTIGIDGPTTKEYTNKDNDASLASVTFNTLGKDIDINNIFILVQGTTDNYGPLNDGSASADEIYEMIENVELRNEATGQSIAGVRLTGSNESGSKEVVGFDAGGTYQIYRFDAVEVRGNELWSFLVDFIDNGSLSHPKSGDQFRIHICGEPTHVLFNQNDIITNTNQCIFDGLTTPSTWYQMDIVAPSTGGKVGDIRPRGNIAGNFHTVKGETSSQAHLSITQKAFGTLDTAVENQKDINLLRFEAYAQGEDLLLTQVMVEAQNGTTRNIQNYAIWVDTDGNNIVDTILEDGVAPNGSRATFNNMAGGGYALPKNQPIVFEVHGDVASSLTSNVIQLRFEIGLEGYIGIETLDPDNGGKLVGIITDNARCRGGDETGCDITVTTTDSVRWNLAKQGDLFITQDTTPLRNRQLLGGVLGEAILRLTLHAQKEDIDVTDLRFTALDNVRSIDRLELYFPGESQSFAIATLGGCGNELGDFCANMENRQLVVLKGNEIDVIVRPRMKTDEQGGISGEVLSIGLTARNSVDARGDSSQNGLPLSNNNGIAEGEIFVGQATPTDNGNTIRGIWGNDNRSVLAKITSITNANPDANETAVPGNTNPDVESIYPIGQFKFTAAAHNNSKNGDNDVIIESILWTVNATNVAIAADSFALYNKADQTKKVSCRPLTIYGNLIEGVASGTLLVECTGLYASRVLDSEIDEGSDTTLVLQASIINSNSATSRGGVSVLQVSLQQFNRIGRKYGYGSENSHIQWIDRDARTFRIFEWIEYPETVIKSTSYNS